MTKEHQLLYMQYLIANGWKVDPNARTSKYKVLTHPHWKEEKYFFGRRNSVRYGKTIRKSVSMTEYVNKIPAQSMRVATSASVQFQAKYKALLSERKKGASE